MTKALVIAALTVLSASAYASKARVSALSNSVTDATDFQDIFTNPAKMQSLGDQVTIEYGSTSTATATGTAKAEGGFIRGMGDGKLAFYVGRQSTDWSNFNNTVFNGAVGGYYTHTGNTLTTGHLTAANNAVTAGYGQSNPLNLVYQTKMNDMSVAAGLYYANYKLDGSYNANSTGFSFGALTSGWNAYLNYNTGKVAADGSSMTPQAGPYLYRITTATGVGAGSLMGQGNDWEIKLKSATTLGGEYNYGSVVFFGSYNMYNGTVGTPTASATLLGTEQTFKGTTLTLGAEDKVAIDGGNFFYGASLVMASSSTDAGITTNPELKSTSNTLPFYAGVDVDVTSWMVARTSLKQNVFYGETKTDSIDRKSVV